MRRILSVLNVLGAVLLVATYVSAADFVPYTREMGILERIDNADLIVVGVATSERPVRGGEVTRGAVIVPLQLMEVQIDVEGVVKGNFSIGKSLRFMYYKATGAWDGPAPNIIQPQQRSLFFLKKEGQILRATNDAYLSHTAIVTGSRPVQTVSENQAIRRELARILLLPGEHVDPSQYVKSLYREREYAFHLVGETETAELLRALLQNANGSIRGRACILLNTPPLNQKSCLGRIRDDVAVPVEDRTRARDLLLKQ
jgi:hypothetical protein